MSDTKPAIVLVHGAWGGGWIWRRILGPLREAGYEVHAVTLTGDGERAHLRRPDIDLHTHIADVVGLVEMEELDRVILVGHSYGGMVATGAAVKLQETHPGILAGLAYVDAMFPHSGDGWGIAHPPEVVEARLKAAAEYDNGLPAPDASEGFAVSAEDAAWLNRRHTIHPFGMYRQTFDYDESLIQPLPRLFIDCTDPAYPTIAPVRKLVREEPGWEVVEIATGHFPMISTPDELVAHLRGFADRLSE
ncbi:alpha/beta hydrolase [Microbacterium sediminicola]|uniref:Alpha/beta hydrolase n=1 Tax=Microbacterium sediminicola TaxID=415210 RepID=A0ABP4UDR5_9MICO